MSVKSELMNLFLAKKGNISPERSWRSSWAAAGLRSGRP